MNTLTEEITKAHQGMNLVVSDIQAAHKAACDQNPYAEVILLDLLGEALALEKKLERLVAAGREG